MLRRQLSLPLQLASSTPAAPARLCAYAAVIAPAHRSFFAPSAPRAFVYSPPGSNGRDGPTALPWHLRRQQQQQQQRPASTSPQHPLSASAVDHSAQVVRSTSGAANSHSIGNTATANHSHQPGQTQPFEGVVAPPTATPPPPPPPQSPPQSPKLESNISSNNSGSQSFSNALGSGNGANGALKATPARRMSSLTGPSLDTRVDEIVRVEQDAASEMLPAVVARLIDADADGVERISLSEFTVMQPRRQLAALGGRRQWHEFLLNTPHYAQASRLAVGSASQDLRSLQQAGITTLHQWAENHSLVAVSPRTRSALDAAVEQSVRAYMTEVAQVVNTSSQLAPLLHHWVSDVVGKFVLDSLQISVESASAALWRRRRASAAATAPSSSSPSAGAGAGAGAGGAAALSAMLQDDGAGTAASAAEGQAPVLRPGEACTIEHFHHFCQKVLFSVRQDAQQQQQQQQQQNRFAAGDAQAEAEIQARTHTVIATALTQLLERAVAQHLPAELAPLHRNGYLAMDRLPALLRRAVSFLQLRTIPVRSFVLHTTADASAGAAERGGGVGKAVEAVVSSALNVPSPSFGPGTFLTGADRPDVTLGEWSGVPEPPSSTHERDAAEEEYLAVLRRIRRHLDDLSMTPLFDVVANAEAYGADGFAAYGALGLDQLFGQAKLIEDRLVSALSYPPATAARPIHFVEAGNAAGKTALLERLRQRRRAGERAVMVRYSGSSTPFVPDLDDHPIAFPSRFWLRVALGCCPFLVRTEELFSRAPRSVMWWGNDANWTWDTLQNMIACAGSRRRSSSSSSAGGGAATAAAAAAASAEAGDGDGGEQLATILVDDMDLVLDSMERKWGFRGSAMHPAGPRGVSLSTGAAALAEEEADLDEADDGNDNDNDDDDDGADGDAADAGERRRRAARRAEAAAAVERRRNERRALSELAKAEEQQKAVWVWTATGKTIPDLLAASFAKVTVALGQVDCVIAGQRLSPIFTHHTQAPVRRYFLPVASGVGLTQRLRVLPLLAAVHALHLRAQLEMPGLLYEVLKNCPGLTGKVLELFWSGRVSQLDLRSTHAITAPGSAAPRLLYGSTGPIVYAYTPQELFADMPLREHLLQDPRRARLRLVELLQRQLGSATGYLTTGVDATASDIRAGIVTPHSHTTSQVHPFALFIIFSHQEALETAAAAAGRHGGPSSPASAATATDELGMLDGGERGGPASSPSAAAAAAGAAGRAGDGLPPKERKLVRAWAEVWSEYRAVVNGLATTPERRRDAMRVLLHGALLLRSAAVAGAEVDLSLKVPNYGFPLLSSEVRMKGKHVVQPIVDGAEVRPATAETVRKAAAAYKAFFSHAAQSHFSFRPMVGLNGGCDVVCVSGTTLALYDIVATTEELREMPYRVAEALVGVLHVLERQVMPVDKVKHIRYVTVVSIDQAGGPSSSSAFSSTPSPSYSGRPTRHFLHDLHNHHHHSGSSSGAIVPYLLDLHALFEDAVLDRLKVIQEPLGITNEFRTLRDILDELEARFHVKVQQDIVATPDELEALFSPTLLQLVPDATVLPPYTQAVVSAEELMMRAMASGSAAGQDGAPVTGTALDELIMDDDGMLVPHGSRPVYHSRADDLLLSDPEDALLAGAEADDISAERLLAPAGGRRDPLLADDEVLHESAELLAAMLSDPLDDGDAATLTEHYHSSGAPLGTSHATNKDSRNNDNNDNNIPSPAPFPRHAPPQQRQEGRPTAAPAAAAAAAAHDPAVDSLAWLHDVISPDALFTGARAATTTTTTTTATTTTGLDENDDDDAEGQRGPSPAAAAPRADAATDAEAERWREALASGGVETTEEVFPLTAAKRQGPPRGETEADDDDVDDDEDDDEDDDDDEGEAEGADDDEGEVDVAQLLDRVGSRTSKARRAAAAAATRRSTAGGKKKAGAGGRGTAAAAAPAAKRSTRKPPKKASVAASARRGAKPKKKPAAKRGGRRK